MKLTIRTITLFLILCFLSEPAVALTKEERAAVTDSLYSELAICNTPEDSLTIMLNLYDVLSRGKGNLIADSIIKTAMRAGDSTMALDMIRNDVNRNMRNDSLLEARLELTLNKFPLSDAREETETFIRMLRNMRRTMYADDVERNELLATFKQQFDHNPPTDLYERIVLLHGICMVLSQDPNTNLLSQYLDSLGNLINQLPPSALSVKNAYYIHAAAAYVDNNPEKAIEADRHSLKNIDRLETIYKERGRMFRNYNPSRYTIYCRMLMAFSKMSDADFKDIYEKAMQLTKIDPDVAGKFNVFPEPTLFYALKNHDYETAYPILKYMLKPETFKQFSSPRRIRALKYFIETAQALGKKDEVLEASLKLNDILDKEMAFRTQGLFREIRLAYADYDMRRHYNDLESTTLKQRARMTTIVAVLSTLGLVLTLIFAIMVVVQYRKVRVMAKSLKLSNAKLKKESENLRTAQHDLVRARDTAVKANTLKSDFIKNLSYEIKTPLQAINEYSRLIADCADPATKEYLGRFTDLIDHNSDLLTTIINDALHLSQLESDTMTVQKQIVSLRTLCRATIDTVTRRFKNPEIKMQLAQDLPDIQISTDQSRVQQILTNLLINAVKFTQKGTITLGYTVDEDTNKVNFYVEDTGIGINPENKDKIFERFVKLDPNTQGAGLGLTISRMLARLLGGDLSLDTKYSGGARFVLTLSR